MKQILASTASSCGVATSGINRTAPTPLWIVSSSVSPVNTRIVSCCSSDVSVSHDCISLESGTFSGNQKFPVNLFQTSRSFSSPIRFQLIARTELAGFTRMFIRKSLKAGATSKRAGHAAFNLRALKRHLAQPNVVDGFDAILPRENLRTIDVPRCCGVAEEQRQRKALVHVLRGGRIRFDDLFGSDLVGVLVIIQIVIGHERRRIIDAADLAFLADLDLRDDRVDR